jgi:hypothetical protein
MHAFQPTANANRTMTCLLAKEAHRAKARMGP